MVIPYSKQINVAFDQVTLLVVHGFKVLHTTSNTTYILVAIHVLITIFWTLY